jgi:hypothetical protein
VARRSRSLARSRSVSRRAANGRGRVSMGHAGRLLRPPPVATTSCQTGAMSKRSMNCWSTARDFGAEKRRYLACQLGGVGCCSVLVEDGGEGPALQAADTPDETAGAVLLSATFCARIDSLLCPCCSGSAAGGSAGPGSPRAQSRSRPRGYCRRAPCCPGCRIAVCQVGLGLGSSEAVWREDNGSTVCSGRWCLGFIVRLQRHMGFIATKSEEP